MQMRVPFYLKRRLNACTKFDTICAGCGERQTAAFHFCGTCRPADPAQGAGGTLLGRTARDCQRRFSAAAIIIRGFLEEKWDEQFFLPLKPGLKKIRR